MRTDYIHSSLYHQLYLRMSYENSLALRTSLETGLRISDVLNLKKDDLSGRTISYIASKTQKAGKSVISADLSKRLCKISGKKYIFEGRSGKKPRTRQAVWQDVKRASRELKLQENVAPHSARKTFAVEDFHANGLPHTQKELQHDRVDTTMLYAFSDVMTHGAVGGNSSQLNRIENKLDRIIEYLIKEKSTDL